MTYKRECVHSGEQESYDEDEDDEESASKHQNGEVDGHDFHVELSKAL